MNDKMTCEHVTVQTDLQCHEEEADNYPGVTTVPAPYGHQSPATEYVWSPVVTAPVLRSGSDCNETLTHQTRRPIFSLQTDTREPTATT